VRSANDLLVIPVVTQAINRPHQYQEVMWAMERARGRAVLIDLAQVRVLKLSFFEALAAGWSSTWHVTKLGVRVSFEQWAGLHRAIEPLRRHLERKGVALALFYDGQDHGVWYREGRIVHDAEAVVDRLCTSSELSIRWPVLLDAATSLLDGYGAHRRAEALVKLAQLALDCGVEKKALELAHESLLFYKALPAEQECKARRIMGEALLHLGQSSQGISCIEDAIEIGTQGEAWDEAATAAYALGLHASYHEDFALAETQYRRALHLLPHEPSERLGQVHAALAIALFRQAKDVEADAHLTISCEMRAVSANSSATDLERSRSLLAYMRSSRKSPIVGWQN
jgi:tetratricopeptide (TPR) repeat protein